MYPILKLKNEKQHILAGKHPWIFSDSFRSFPSDLQHGALVYLEDNEGNIVATGGYSTYSMHAVRVFEWKKVIIDLDWWIEKFKKLKELRELVDFRDNSHTNGFRLVFAESDGIPGLIVDKFDKTLVIQSSIAVIDNQMSNIVEALDKVYKPDVIYERSDTGGRNIEQIEDRIIFHKGEESDLPEFKENGMKFYSDTVSGQKTGFFLDQKDLRLSLSKFAKNRSVLNLFSYTAASSIYALKSGAKSALNVDISQRALEIGIENMELNKIPVEKYRNEKADVIEWLKSNSDKFDMVILDPPAFIKSRSSIVRGQKAYHHVNREAMKIVKPNGIFVTSSCSHYFEERDFETMLRKISSQIGREVRVLEKVIQSKDHPLSLYFPEGKYLKSYICLCR